MKKNNVNIWFRPTELAALVRLIDLCEPLEKSALGQRAIDKIRAARQKMILDEAERDEKTRTETVPA